LLQPAWQDVAQGFIPQASTLIHGDQLFLAAGILGATVMPHNLYLHSSLVKTRQWESQQEGRKEARKKALRFSTLDTLLALSLAFFVNAAILVLAGGSFYGRPGPPVTDLSQAYHLLTPIMGTSIASVLFGIALLASGQSSTLTATMAGQVVMEGFLKIRLPDWQRRLLTRCLALIPAMVTVIVLGDLGINKLLVFSQVLLSLQLPFAAIPLVWLCGQPELMAELVTPRWLQLVGWGSAGLIVLINGALLLSTGAAIW